MLKSLSNWSFSKGVALYNSEEKRLIGVFRTCTAASMYVLGDRYKEIQQPQGYISAYIRGKNKIGVKSSVHPFKIAPRTASPEQIALIPNGKEFILL